MRGSTLRRLAIPGPAVIAALLLLLSVPGAAQEPTPTPKPAPPAQPSPPPAAEEFALAVIQALGGKEAWDSTRHICFNFNNARFHCWDKLTGNHRLEGQNQQGQKFVVLHNINTREGSAYLDGQAVPADQLKQYLDGAFAAWTNDTYWLLMPYKLQDPGVNLTYAGSEEIDGVRYEKLQLTFGQNVGLTPGDRYWVYINPQSGLIERWAYVLQNQDPNSRPTQWLWQGWQRYGNIMLAPTRLQVGGEGKLEFANIVVTNNLVDTVYTSPQPLAAGEAQAPPPGQ